MDDLAKRGDGLMQFGGHSARMATSLDLTEPNNRVKMLRAMQDCDARLTECVNMDIAAVDYVAHDVDLTSKETGEVVTATRLVLIDADGMCYECVSATLLKSLQTVSFAFGPPPWNPPLTLTVKTKKRGERSIYFFATKA